MNHDRMTLPHSTFIFLIIFNAFQLSLSIPTQYDTSFSTISQLVFRQEESVTPDSFHIVESLENLSNSSNSGVDTTGNDLQTLQSVYTAIGPELPADLVSTPVQSSLQEQVFLYNYDEGHAGRFSVPNTPGGSVSFDDIISRPDAVSYILEQLTFYPNAGSPRSTAELIAFVPGLNTLHQPFPGTTSTVERLIHYSKVMNLPMAQIHLGTALDQGDVIIKPQSAASLLPLLEPRLNSLPRFLRPSIGEDGSIVFGNFTVDGLQVALSYPNLIDIPIKQSIRKLLSSKKPVTILAYSRGSLEVEAALRQYIQENDISFEELRGQVTVLSIGNACRNWPDGPAYLHLSTRTDPLTRSRGVYADRPQGSGRDAVFIECDSPFHPESFDNHNFGSIKSHYFYAEVASDL